LTLKAKILKEFGKGGVAKILKVSVRRNKRVG
jgi:hypothetical protein